MSTCFDLTHKITPNMPVYPGTEPPVLERANTIEVDGFAEKLIKFYSHTGTHMDAPAHMIPGGQTLDEYPVDQFTGNALKLDVRTFANQQILLEFLVGYEQELNDVDFLILYTGWSDRWGSEAYFSDFPTLTVEAAVWLAEQGLKGVGLDAISIDPVGDDFSNHLKILDAGMVIIENLTNLEKLPTRFDFFCLPLKIEDADGSPIRAIGIVH